MSYKSILLFLEPDDNESDLSDLAIELAARENAHLTVLVPAYEPSLPYYSHHPLLADVLEAQRETTISDAKAAAATLSAEAERQGVVPETRVELCFPGAVTDLINLHARYNDLIIMKQPDPEEPGPAGRHLPEGVLIGAGRPVLMMPYIGTKSSPGTKVLVAWDAGREAARAITDALPILTRAEAVTLLTVEPKPSLDGHGEEPGADIALFLSRHGCPVQVEVLRDSSIGMGETILSYIGDRDYDLLVMGAYGHSRLREVILGGVTQEILGHMTIPTFASH